VAMQQPIARNLPRWLMMAHARSQRVGTARSVMELALLTGALASIVALAVAPLLGVGVVVWVAAAAFAAVAAVTALMLGTTVPVVQELTVARKRMVKAATHDALTGIVNHRHFTQLAYREWERCRRYRSGAAMLMLDPDHFNTIEEEHGKAAGDAVLRAIAIACDGLLRKPDLMGRYAGEHIVMFLPHTDLLGAIDVAERVRAAVAQTRVSWPTHPIRVTVSVGVATLGEQHLSLNALMLDAEAALHAAQNAGRNCVRSSPAPASRSGKAYPVMPG
jgi:diguanylate cyclase